MQKVKLSIEELAYALGVMGGQDVAGGFLLAILGERSPDEIKSRLLAASHALIARDLLALNLDTKSKQLNPELVKLIMPLIANRFSLRCSRSEKGMETLLNFYFGDVVVEYRSENEIVTAIELLPAANMVYDRIGRFFELGRHDGANPAPRAIVPASLIESLKDEADSLTEQEIRIRLVGGGIEELAARDLASDFKNVEFRGSVIRIEPRNGETVANEGFLILKSLARGWLFEIIPDAPPKLRVWLATQDSFSGCLYRLLKTM